ncbi:MULTISPECIES: pantetheine-phosphate adenylyltransferase [Desulfofundulus]|uniref:Phosphopantetheine adenylyltransferase n=1 Tax=Desulfofundulus australicus DSM 11792 TaxID=1121425 RepID=A0A1M5DJA2_9FIRM|nr:MULTISPECIES: pantetheine-phosphate adenylyltransferase [Desulfofundulus]MBE3586421.1 pantetheine-phosphate adenylyltransferase [Thermoanaerobacter sp.]MCS5696728.1 pantetheine-phosphate adenylyltransferase [Desulfofundulus thermocisternus]MDK2888404.1 pantetheine-phosphate adenylyltransferase [Thermoanaerobacter sp.]SHF66996.1 Phosphopantetheine adenylyltransferase [Desulfofundulus australicus DSM 11792]
MRIAVYPGSFDPITNGHLDVIERAACLFDQLVVAVSRNTSKKPLFTVSERLEMLREVLQPYYNVVVDSFDGLTVNYAKNLGAQAIIRGLRAISDFENEFMMALTNKKLVPSIDTLFLMTRAEYSFISSSAVKEVAYFGGCVRDLVPPVVEQKLREKFMALGRPVREG